MKIRIALLMTLLALLSATLRAETPFAMAVVGEDATSAFYYFFYRMHEEQEITRVRSVWNGGAQNPPAIIDFFLDGEVRVVKSEGTRNRVAALIKGKDLTGRITSDYKFAAKPEEPLLSPDGSPTLSAQERRDLSHLLHALSLPRESLKKK